MTLSFMIQTVSSAGPADSWEPEPEPEEQAVRVAAPSSRAIAERRVVGSAVDLTVGAASR